MTPVNRGLLLELGCGGDHRGEKSRRSEPSRISAISGHLFRCKIPRRRDRRYALTIYAGVISVLDYYYWLEDIVFDGRKPRKAHLGRFGFGRDFRCGSPQSLLEGLCQVRGGHAAGRNAVAVSEPSIITRPQCKLQRYLRKSQSRPTTMPLR